LENPDLMFRISVDCRLPGLVTALTKNLTYILNTYLTEEIMAEGVIRKLPPFSRFLHTVVLANTQTINFAKLGNDCQVPPPL